MCVYVFVCVHLYDICICVCVLCALCDVFSFLSEYVCTNVYVCICSVSVFSHKWD